MWSGDPKALEMTPLHSLPFSSSEKRCLFPASLKLYSHLSLCVCFSLIAEGGSGRGPPDHYPCPRESHRLLQALHDPRCEHLVSKAQWHQPQCLLLPQPPVPRHLDVRAPRLSGGQLCPLCHCQVRDMLWPEFWPKVRISGSQTCPHLSSP